MYARFVNIRQVWANRLVAIMLALVVLLITPTLAKSQSVTWYVDAACRTCGEGTRSSPYSAIQAALAVADNGDTILVAGATYTENLAIDAQIVLMGGYDAREDNWYRDVQQYETIVTSADRTVPGDWDGDWLGSFCIVRDQHAYRMWYSAGSEISGAGIGYADSPDRVHWFQPYATALLLPGAWDAWDGAMVADPMVLSTETGLRMWYVGTNASGERGIGCAASPDGFSWQKCDNNPVLRPDSADADSFGHPAVIQAGPGDYKMWYSGGGAIWMATSPDGINWDKAPGGPVLTPGPRGRWDDARIYAPTVIATAERYEMWYVGESTRTAGPRIGHAWSQGGSTWNKSPAYPVLTGQAGYWEERAVTYPAVTREGESEYQMWYLGGDSDSYAIGWATSANGMAWTRYDDNPVILPGKPTHWGAPVVSFGSQSDGAVLDGFTIRNGYAEHGGGILAYNTSPTIRASRIVGNVAHRGGGGLWLGNGSPIIENSVISENSSIDRGGGIVSSYASTMIENSVIADNTACTYGGGLAYLGSSRPNLADTVVAGNTARWGGGVYVGDDVYLEAFSVQIFGNTAEQAAGTQVAHATLDMTNTAVVDNVAILGGPGGLLFWQSSGSLINVTIAGNHTGSGTGGIAFSTLDPADQLNILNSILFFNGAQDLSCSGGTCTVTYSDVSQGVAGQGNISADPEFVDRQAGDYHLGAGSPAIDAGTSAGAPRFDWEGDRRPAGQVDMGADEFAGQ